MNFYHYFCQNLSIFSIKNNFLNIKLQCHLKIILQLKLASDFFSFFKSFIGKVCIGGLYKSIFYSSFI